MSNPYTNYPPDQNPQNQPGYGQPQDPYAPNSTPYASEPYAQSGYQQSAYAAPPAYPAAPQNEPGSGMALAGLILGIVGLVLSFFVGCGSPFAIVGIILSVMGRRSVSRRTMANIGLGLSIAALVVTLIWAIFYIAIFAAAGSSGSY